MSWSARPFLRIFIFLVSGILIAYWVPFIGDRSPVNSLFLIVIFLVIGFVVYKSNFSWTRRWIIGVILGFSIFLTGILLVNVKQNNRAEMPAGNFETTWEAK